MTQTCSPSNSLVLNWRRGPFAGYALTIHDRKVLLHWPQGEELPYPKLLFIQGPRGAMLRSIGDDVNVNGVVSDVHWLAAGDELSHPRFAARVGFESDAATGEIVEPNSTFTSQTELQPKRPARPSRAWRRIRRDIRRLESQWAGLDQVIQGDISLRLEQMTQQLEALSSQLTTLPAVPYLPASPSSENESTWSTKVAVSRNSECESAAALVEAPPCQAEPLDLVVPNPSLDDVRDALDCGEQAPAPLNGNETPGEDEEPAPSCDTNIASAPSGSGFVVWNDEDDAADLDLNQAAAPTPAISDRSARFFRKSKAGEQNTSRSGSTETKGPAADASQPAASYPIQSDESADPSTRDESDQSNSSSWRSVAAVTSDEDAQSLPTSDSHLTQLESDLHSAGHDQDDDVLDKATASLNAYAASSTTVSTPARTPRPESSAVTAEGDSHEHSAGDDVSSYMAKFFSRLNLNVAPQESQASNETRHATTVPHKTPLIGTSLAETRSTTSQPSKNDEYTPQSQAPERKIDLNTLRQLANQSTRNAIQSFAQRKKLQGKTTNLLWMGAAFATSVVLLAVSRQPGDLMFLAGITILVSSSIASIWVLLKEKILERLALLRLPADPAADVASSTEESSCEEYEDGDGTQDSAHDSTTEAPVSEASQPSEDESLSTSTIEQA